MNARPNLGIINRMLVRPKFWKGGRMFMRLDHLTRWRICAMAKSSLVERLARQGRVQTILRVTNGSPEEIVLKPLRKAPDVISATLAMVRRGATMLHAKRAVEKAMAEGSAVIHLPVVEDRKALTDDLEIAGMSVTFGSTSHNLCHRGADGSG